MSNDLYEKFRLQSLKKRICNPPAVRVAECGDPEVCGLFEGAGDGLAYALGQVGSTYSHDGEANEGSTAVLKALAEFEKSVVTIESAYIHGRQNLAERTAQDMQEATHKLMKAVGGEAYGGG